MCRLVNCIAVASNVAPRESPRCLPPAPALSAYSCLPCGISLSWRQPGLALQLRRHLGLEALQVANDPARLVGLVAIHVHPRQLVPAERAHRLELGVALQRGHGFVEAAL